MFKKGGDTPASDRTECRTETVTSSEIPKIESDVDLMMISKDPKLVKESEIESEQSKLNETTKVELEENQTMIRPDDVTTSENVKISKGDEMEM